MPEGVPGSQATQGLVSGIAERMQEQGALDGLDSLKPQEGDTSQGGCC